MAKIKCVRDPDRGSTGVLTKSDELIRLWNESRSHSKRAKKSIARRNVSATLVLAEEALIAASKFRELCWAHHGMSPMDVITEYKERGWLD